MEYRFFTALLGSFRLHKADKSSENESKSFQSDWIDAFYLLTFHQRNESFTSYFPL